MILLKEVDNPTMSGVMVFDKDRVLVRVVKKPKIPPSNYASASIYFFKPGVLNVIRKLKPS